MFQKNSLLIVLLVANCVVAQRSNDSRFDSLSGRSLEYLKTSYEANIYDRSRSGMYAEAWLRKAKRVKNDYFQLALAYKASIVITDKSSRLSYADSMIVCAVKTNDKELIGSSYMTKGIVYYDRMEHSKALDNI